MFVTQGAKCELALKRATNIVARGTAPPSLPIDVCHGVKIGWQNLKVTVEEVFRPFAALPVLTFKFRTVGDAEGAIIAWPLNLVNFLVPEVHVREIFCDKCLYNFNNSSYVVVK